MARRPQLILSLTLLPLAASYSCLAATRFAAAAAKRRAITSTMLFDNVQWPWDREPAASDEAGKFMRHNELQPGGAPLGLVCAGFDEDALEALAMAVEDVLSDAEGQPTAHVPIAVLGRSDLRLRLRDILAQLDARDSVLPEQPSTPRAPLVLLSGFSTVATSATVRAVRALGLTGGATGDARPMFAVAVPNALDKSLRVLIEEIEGDHLANQNLNQGMDAPPPG